MRSAKSWKDVSIAKKLYFVVGIMALLIVGELLTLRFAMHTLSAARAFVGGEGLWSKSQKNAAISLQRYGLTKDEADFASFLGAMQVPEGDHRARMELFKPAPDRSVIRAGFLQGRIHVDDIDPMIDLLQRFAWTSYLSRAIAVWGAADDMLTEFKTAGLAYHAAVVAGDATAAARGLTEIKRLNEGLTALEDEFSYVLGVGSRWIERVVLTLLSLAVLAVESVGLTLTFLTSRSISRGLNELNVAAGRIGGGDFAGVVLPRSRDEIGQLARSVNQMGRMLQRSYAELEVRVKERTAELARSRDAVRFLDEASQILASSMSYRETLPRIATLAVPRLADECAIDLLLPDGDDRVERLAQVPPGAHEIPAPGARADGLDGRGGAENPDEGASTMIVPLRAREKVFGVLALKAADSRPRYGAADRRVAEELARRIGIAIENATLFELAQKAIREREDFLSIASHELNTPLTSLRLQIQMARQRVARVEGGDGARPPLARALEISESQVMRLSRLVEELLDVSRIKAGKLAFTFERLDLSETVRAVVGRFADQLAAVGSPIGLAVEDGVVGTFDQMRIEQVIDNLLTNAMKYASGKAVRVALTRADGTATLIVEDDGPGIPEAQHATIFERFARVVTTGSVAGLGLGLFIVKEIVDGQGGSVRVQSRPGEGTRFVVTLPLADGPLEAPHDA